MNIDIVSRRSTQNRPSMNSYDQLTNQPLIFAVLETFVWNTSDWLIQIYPFLSNDTVTLNTYLPDFVTIISVPRRLNFLHNSTPSSRICALQTVECLRANSNRWWGSSMAMVVVESVLLVALFNLRCFVVDADRRRQLLSSSSRSRIANDFAIGYRQWW